MVNKLLFISIFFIFTGANLSALIISDEAVVEAKIISLFDTLVPDDETVPDILKVSYIAEIEIIRIIEKDDFFYSSNVIERLKGSIVRINGIEYDSQLAKEKAQTGDYITCFISYYSEEYHHHGYKTSIHINILDIFQEADYLDEKKQQILEILKSDEYQNKEEVLQHTIHPENVYITEWKVSDFIKELEQQQSQFESITIQSQNMDNALGMYKNQLEKIKIFLKAISTLETNTYIYEVKLPGLRRNYYLLVDLEQKKVLEVYRISLPI